MYPESTLGSLGVRHQKQTLTYKSPLGVDSGYLLVFLHKTQWKRYRHGAKSNKR